MTLCKDCGQRKTYRESRQKIHEDNDNEEDEDEEGDVAEVGHIVKGDVRELQLPNKHGEGLENGESDFVQELPLLVPFLVDPLNDLLPDVGATLYSIHHFSFFVQFSRKIVV